MSVLDKFDLKRRIAIVTGGAGFLGERHARALLDAGATVYLFDLNEERLASVSDRLSEHGAVFIETVDVTREADLVAAAGRIKSAHGRDADILINNAAIDPKLGGAGPSATGRLETYSLDQWRFEIEVGLTGAMLCTRVFGAAMAAGDGGVILNVASDLGIIAPDQRLYRRAGLPDAAQQVKPVTYSVIKHGLIGLTRYTATYWARAGVRCNALAPGGVFNDHSEEFVQRIANLVPMGRMARPDEYEGAILFLCSEASSYINGAVLVADGGRSVW